MNTQQVPKHMDIKQIAAQQALLLERIPDIYRVLNSTRQAVLVNMCFDMGIEGLMSHQNILSFVAIGDFERAANNMLVSRWAKQQGARAIELSEQMRKGK